MWKFLEQVADLENRLVELAADMVLNPASALDWYPEQDMVEVAAELVEARFQLGVVVEGE